MSAAGALSAWGIKILPHERLVVAGGQRLELTAREFDILAHLAEHPGWVYSVDQLADGDEQSHDFSLDSVRVHVAHLRHKLEIAGLEGVIDTVRGVGYRLANPEIYPADSSDTAAVPGRANVHQCTARLRDCLWLLEQAVVELERLSSDAGVVEAACDALDAARTTIEALLGEGTPDTL